MKRAGTLISLTGYATAGKDTLADQLVKEYGYVKVGWSDALYKLALFLNPRVGPWPWSERLKRLVERVGWVESKRRPFVRKFLQELGTEGVRECLGQDAWVSALMPKIKKLRAEGKNVVVTNTRFRNEALAIFDAGGTLVEVVRDGVGPVNGHASDSGEAFELATCTVNNPTADPETVERNMKLAAKTIHEGIIDGDSGKKSVIENSEMAVRRYLDLLTRCMDIAQKAMLEAASHDGDIDGFKKRNRVEVETVDNGLIMCVNGECVGEASYEDGQLTIDLILAR